MEDGLRVDLDISVKLLLESLMLLKVKYLELKKNGGEIEYC